MPQPKAGHLRFLAYLLLAATIPALAQQPKGPQQQPAAPTLKVTTQLTRVDVTVTDANGHPVHGLPQSAFTVKEDGKPQPIKNFEEFGTAKPAPPAPPLVLPPNVYTNAQPQLPTTSAVNVLLIDNVTTGRDLKIHPENVATSTREATKFLTALPVGTQVILLDLTSQLQIVQPLTTDRDVLLAALHSIVYKQNARTTLPCIPMAPCEASLSDECNAANAQSQLVVGGLDAASAYLSGIKGRKNIIWFTPGIPWLTDYPSYDRIPCMQDHTAALQRDYTLLAAAQAALYPISPNGVEYPTPPPNEHISLEDLADATGGQAFYNNNNLAAEIGKAIVIGTDSYSLSYVPPIAKYDGQYHKINVQLNQPGLHLVYRKGYTSLDPAKAASAAAQTAAAQPPSKLASAPDAALHAAVAHGAPPSTQILFTVAVTPTIPAASPTDPPLGQLNPNLKLKDKHLVRYDFEYRVLPGDLTLAVALDGKRHASVEFTVAAYDGQGEILNVLGQTASFTVPPDKLAAFLRYPYPFLVHLDLPPGSLFLRAVVRDVSSNKLGSLEIPLTVPK